MAAKEECENCGTLDWLNEDGECRICEESFLGATVEFLHSFTPDDVGLRCSCEDYPCCGH